MIYLWKHVMKMSVVYGDDDDCITTPSMMKL